MNADFHKTEFDDVTQLKLDIYKEYIRKWLPVFVEKKVKPPWNGKINIFDFFCGPGKDSAGRNGSPVVAINECRQYNDRLEEKGRSVNLFFSDENRLKIDQLNKLLSEYQLPSKVRYQTNCEAFSHAFIRKLREISGAANLIFIDQCGVKQVTERVFKTLVDLKGTDFIFFIASSYFNRFKTTFEFRKYLNLANHLDEDTPYTDTHRVIADVYRSMLPPHSSYYLTQFSLKKGSNIYGLIFGSSNLAGIAKFLEVLWKIDPERGEANFDIDDDKLPSKRGDIPDFFKDNTRSKKVTLFQDRLSQKLLAGDFSSDRDVFIYALESGFIPTKHAKEVVITLIKEGVLFCDGQPRMSKICIKDPRAFKLG